LLLKIRPDIKLTRVSSYSWGGDGDEGGEEGGEEEEGKKEGRGGEERRGKYFTQNRFLVVMTSANITPIGTLNTPLERTRRSEYDGFYRVHTCQLLSEQRVQELIMRNDNIVGKVENMFYHFEFQSAGTPGNKPHVHCGLSLSDGEPDSVSASRICSNSLLFHDKAFNADFDSLLKLGVVTDATDYERWKTVVAAVNHHDCSKAQYRCMKATKCSWRQDLSLPS
jgi:hypothetical protein